MWSKQRAGVVLPDGIAGWPATPWRNPIARALCRVASLVGWDEGQLPQSLQEIVEHMEAVVTTYAANRYDRDWSWEWLFPSLLEAITKKAEDASNMCDTLRDDVKELADKNSMLIKVLEAA